MATLSSLSPSKSHRSDADSQCFSFAGIYRNDWIKASFSFSARISPDPNGQDVVGNFDSLGLISKE